MSVQMRTILDVADNSGARKLQVILPLGGGLGKKASLGDVVTAAVKEASPDGTVKKGKVVKAVIVRTRKEMPPQGWHLHPLRPERRCRDQRCDGAGRHPRVRSRCPRASREEVSEDRLARA